MFLVLMFVILAGPGAATGPGASPEAWAPFRAFIGTWKGARETPGGKASVSRRYESVTGDRHLQVIERVGSGESPWGIFSFDASLGGFVLRRFGTDGSARELVLEGAGDGASLIFSTRPGTDGSSAERITLERSGWNEFVERVEASTNGQPFVRVSETRFRRKA